MEWQEQDYIVLSYQEEKRHRFLKEFCKNQIRQYSALIFASDFYAIDAINVFYGEGIYVPEDVSVTGFDDNVFAKQCRPRLTTIHQDPSHKAEAATKMLLAMLKGEAVKERNIRLPVSLVVRESVMTQK